MSEEIKAEKKKAEIKNPFTTNVGFSVPKRDFLADSETPYGILYNEMIEVAGREKDKWAKVMRYLDKTVNVDGKDIVISQPITMPPNIIDPNKYYPIYACRMTQTRFDELDFAPTDSWKQFDFKDENGQDIRGSRGEKIVGYFYTIVIFQPCSEQEECTYINMPVKSGNGVILYNGKTYIKGSTIIDRQEAKDTLSMFDSYSARRRAEEDQFVVQV